MSYRPKTAEQIFLTNILVRVVEVHILRRKVRQILRGPCAEEFWQLKLEKLDNRINLLTSAYDNNGGRNV